MDAMRMRVQRAGGVLEDDLHLLAERLECLPGSVEDIGVVEGDLAAGGRDQSQQGSANGGFAAARFSDEAERFPSLDVEGHAVDGLHIPRSPLKQPGPDRKVGLEVLDVEQDWPGCGLRVGRIDHRGILAAGR